MQVITQLVNLFKCYLYIQQVSCEPRKNFTKKIEKKLTSSHFLRFISTSIKVTRNKKEKKSSQFVAGTNSILSFCDLCICKYPEFSLHIQTQKMLIYFHSKH